MSIQKKSLISTLKTAKKANFAAKAEGEEKQVSAMKVPSARGLTAKSLNSARGLTAKSLKSAKQASFRKTLKVVS